MIEDDKDEEYALLLYKMSNSLKFWQDLTEELAKYMPMERAELAMDTVLDKWLMNADGNPIDEIFRRILAEEMTKDFLYNIN